MTFYKSAEQYYSEMTSAESEVDTSEHSLIYKSNMPISMELSYNSMLIDEVENKIHAKSALDNGYYDDLIKRCLDMGIERNLGDYASGLVTISGTLGTTIPSDFMVATKSGKIYKTTIETVIPEEGSVKVLVKAQEVGSSYNAEIGDISSIPVEYKGIDSVTNEEVITNGTDDETYEHLYNRYYSKVSTISTSGNKTDYENWALSVTGVGSATCIPGAGNVKVIISNSNKRAADEELIQAVYDYIDSVRPLLAGTLTITTVKEITINVTANIDIDSSVTLSDIQDLFKTAIETYFDDTVYTSKKISIAKLGALLINIDGVTDYSNLKINTGTDNISLAEDEIAVVGTVTLEES